MYLATVSTVHPGPNAYNVAASLLVLIFAFCVLPQIKQITATCYHCDASIPRIVDSQLDHSDPEGKIMSNYGKIIQSWIQHTWLEIAEEVGAQNSSCLLCMQPSRQPGWRSPPGEHASCS